jgi:hypothetical protein
VDVLFRLIFHKPPVPEVQLPEALLRDSLNLTKGVIMGAFSHLTRRKFIKSAAAGAGAMAASQYVPDELMADTHKKILPPDGRFKNIELTYFQDNNWLHAPLWLS